MTGALRAQRAKHDISHGARHEREIFLFPSSRASRSGRAPREISHSPRLAHKAPVMQAKYSPGMKTPQINDMIG